MLRITREGDTEGDLSIYNVYNPLPANKTKLFTIPLLKDILNILNKYILLGDFNLYYIIQNELGRTTNYTEAKELLIIITRSNLLLLIPQGIITQESRKLRTTIDLAFGIEGVVNTVITCGPREDLKYSLDYIPIQITLDQLIDLTLLLPIKRVQKTAKKVEVRTKTEEVTFRLIKLFRLNNRERIDLFIERIIKALNKIIEITVPIVKPS